MGTPTSKSKAGQARGPDKLCVLEGLAEQAEGPDHTLPECFSLTASQPSSHGHGGWGWWGGAGSQARPWWHRVQVGRQAWQGVCPIPAIHIVSKSSMTKMGFPLQMGWGNASRAPPTLQGCSGRGWHLEEERGPCPWHEVTLHRLLHLTPDLPAEVLGPRWVEASAPSRAWDQ